MKKLFALLAFAALLATSCQDILDVIDDLDDALGGSAPTGAVNGIFTVSKGGSAVYFSKGNLQYQASTKTWRFAENQWDYVGGDYLVETEIDAHFETVHMGTVSGSTNELISATNAKWIDLFGWGTSGYNGMEPYMTVLNPSKYNVGTIAGTEYDWGVHNPISNGGNKAGLWRTLTHDEWDYVIHKRSGSRYAPATVNGVHGLILLPDGWDGSAYTLSNVNLEEDWRNWGFNNISSSDWTGKLERAGAVFFPCAGQRGNINYPDKETAIGGTGPENILPFAGYYWSSTAAGQESAYNMQFGYHNSEVVTRYADYFCQGESVRLVADKK